MPFVPLWLSKRSPETNLLWRSAYEPRVLEGVSVPAEDGVLLGAFDFRAQAELGIWWRLLESAGLISQTRIRIFSSSWQAADQKTLEAVFPRSWQAQIELVTDDQFWTQLIQPDRPERAFAARIKGGMAEMLVIGTPTEEVWERFSRETI